jgi:HEAT repeat protein
MRKTGFAALAVLAVFTGGTVAVADDDARARDRAENWAKLFFKPDAVERFLAGWNLIALAPSSTDAVLGRVDGNKLGKESLVAGAQTLGEMGSPEAAGSLAAISGDSRQIADVRVASVIAVAKIGGKNGVAELTRIASEEAGNDATARLLRCAALVALGMRGDRIEPALVEKALASDDAELRRAAYRAVGFTRDRRFVPHCTKGLDDENALAGAEAARSLGRINDPKSLDQVAAILKKVKSPAIRFLLLEALARGGRKAAIDELIADLEDPASNYQGSSAGALIDIGEKRAIPAFRRVVESALDKRAARLDPGSDVRAVYALGVLNDAPSSALLVRALEHGTAELRREAARALAALRQRDAIPALRMAAAPAIKDRELRAVAILALGEVGEAATGDDIAPYLDDKDPVVRYASCVALGVLGNRRAIPVLKGLEEDEQDFVARAARVAVARLEERATAGADPRDPLVLQRLRALEREYLLRLQLGNLFQSYNETFAQSALPKDAQQAQAQIVQIESLVDSCGGAHPSLSPQDAARVAALQKIVDRGRQAAAREGAKAGQVGELERQQLDESYRLAKVRSDAEAELAEKRGASGGGSGSGATATGNSKAAR